MTASAPPRPPRSTIDGRRPRPLKRRPQWAAFRYGFRDGAWTKIPKQAAAERGRTPRANDPTTWSSFDDALAAFEADPTLDGIGYIFAEDDPYCGVDIDKVNTSPERAGVGARDRRALRHLRRVERQRQRPAHHRPAAGCPTRTAPLRRAGATRRRGSRRTVDGDN